MKTRTKLLTAGVVAAIAIGGTAATVAAGGGDDNETPITGGALDRATAVALEHVGEGRVTGTEVGDEDSFYEVEVTRDDGSQIDVQLDRDFRVVADRADAPRDDEREDD
jgi:hypothetical protein